MQSLVTLYCAHQYIDLRKEKKVQFTTLWKCSRAPRARQGSCRIW